MDLEFKVDTAVAFEAWASQKRQARFNEHHQLNFRPNGLHFIIRSLHSFALDITVHIGPPVFDLVNSNEIY